MFSSSTTSSTNTSSTTTMTTNQGTPVRSSGSGHTGTPVPLADLFNAASANAAGGTPGVIHTNAPANPKQALLAEDLELRPQEEEGLHGHFTRNRGKGTKGQLAPTSSTTSPINHGAINKPNKRLPRLASQLLPIRSRRDVSWLVSTHKQSISIAVSSLRRWTTFLNARLVATTACP